MTKSYNVGLFGINLQVRNSLPFQEQDKVVAACATSALWSLLHGVPSSKSFEIRSPAQITKSATERFPFKNSGHPHPGLTPEMMGYALSSEGLDAQHISLTIPFMDAPQEAMATLKELLYAYLKNKIPMLLGIDIYRKKTDPKRRIYSFAGKHAVTVCGYSLPKVITHSPYAKFCAKAHYINKLFVHDDQVGPFAKVDFVNERVFCSSQSSDQAGLPSGKVEYFLTSGIEDEDLQIAIPNSLLLGLYHKIRVPYFHIKEGIISFNAVVLDVLDFCPEVKEKIFTGIAKNFIWDIHLITSNDAKDEILKSKMLSGKPLLKFLTKHMPKYMWKARAEYEGVPLFDLFFDATDILQGKIFITSVEYTDLVKAFFDVAFGGNNANFPAVHSLNDKNHALVKKIINGLGAKKDSLEDMLTSKFGDARPPLHIKDHELDGLRRLHRLDNIVMLTSSQQIALDESIKYLWAISQDGDLRFAPEIGSPALGHPNLLGSDYARICGELYYSAGKWIINNASGRYSKYAPDITEITLGNVKELFETFLPAYAGKFGTNLSNYHGPNSTNSVDEVLAKCKELATSEINHEALELLASQASYSKVQGVEEAILSAFSEASTKEKVILCWFLQHYWRLCDGEIHLRVIDVFIGEYAGQDDYQLLTAVLSVLLLAHKNGKVDGETEKKLVPIFKDYLHRHTSLPKVTVLDGIITLLSKNGHI